MDNQLVPIDLKDKILVVRGEYVMIDADVAELYGVETKRINEAVKNNPEKFPEGYILPLADEEKKELVENFDRFNPLKHSTVTPKAFTERGLYMLATILKSEAATKATLSIVETYAQVRELKRDLLALHDEKDPEKQKSMMAKFGAALTEIVMPDLQTEETESSLELNFFIGKLKHKVIRRRKSGNDEIDQ